MGLGDTSLKYHKSSHSSEGQAENSQIQESINNTMRPCVSSDEFEKLVKKEYTVNMKEDQNDFYYIAGKSITSARAKSTKENADSEDFSLNTYWENMQVNKYLCTNRENLVKKYIVMSAGIAEEANIEDWSRNYDITNASTNLRKAPRQKNMQLKEYLRVNRTNFAKRNIKMLDRNVEEENMVGRCRNYTLTNELSNLKEARLTSQCSFESF